MAQQPINVTQILGTAPTTAGFFDIKGADGNVFVRCNAAATCPVNATQVTSPWIVAGAGTAGSAASAVLTVQGISSMTPLTVTLTSTTITGNVAVTAASGAYASGSIADGAEVTLGAKADAKSAATDTTAITVMQVLKEISSLEQAPASRAVTNIGTFATQSAITAASGSIASGAIASGAIASGAVASGAIASGACAAGCIADGGDTTLGAKGDAKSTATDTTAITIMQVLKEISALEQAPASRAVTNAGTFAVQSTPVAQTTLVLGTVRVQGNVGAAMDAATGAAPPANAIQMGGVGSGATGGFLIAPPISDTYADINISSATTTRIVTGVSGRQVRIGAMHMITAAANNVAWVEGTGATCGTGTAGMAGGTSSSSGYNFAANGGIAMGSGFGTVLATVTTGDSVCLVTSASTQLSGGIEYTIY